MQARLTAHRRIWGGVLLVTALLLAVLNAFVFVFVRQDAVRRTTDDLATIADNLSDRVEQSLQVVEISLQNLILRYRTQAYEPRDVHLLLRQIEQTLPQIRAIGITDANGTVLHSSRSFPAAATSMASLEHIAAYVRGSRAVRYLSGPTRNMVDSQWQLSLALPILGDGDSLLGIATTVIDPGYFSEAFVRTASAHGDAVSLLFGDYRLVASRPWREAEMGLSRASEPLYAALAAGSGPIGTTFVSFSGEERLGLARRLYHDHLILSVSRPMSDVLAQWRTLAWVSAAISLALLTIELVALLGAKRNLNEVELKEQELLSLNKRLAAQTRRAERLANAKGNFLANMSHEIRTPLGGMLGYADLLLKSGLDGQRRDWLNKLRSAGDQLLAVINDILDYSRIESGEFSIEPRAVALAPLFEEVHAMMAPQAEARGLALRFDIAPGLPSWIRIDPVRLKQVLINLVGNAVKFTDAGSVSVEATAGTLPGARPALRITVADTGIGIPARKLATVFERFTQAESNAARGRGGTGLGLSISRRLAELMGGTLSLASSEGRGTTVDVALPLEPAEAPAAEQAAGAAAIRPARVLVVDDLPTNLEIVEAMLTSHGHTVVKATRGLQAVDVALIGEFDVILLDVNLPDIDGYEVAREIRKLEGKERRTPILAFSANALPEHIARMREAGMDGHVAKPIDERALIGQIAGLLADGKAAASGGARQAEAVPLVDHDAVAAMKRVLGEPRFAAMQAEFWSSWRAFADLLSSPATSRDDLAARAHDMVSQAGHVGYLRVAEACRHLSAAADSQDDLGPAIARVRAAAEDSRHAAASV